jgi:hypothetical protein
MIDELENYKPTYIKAQNIEGKFAELSSINKIVILEKTDDLSPSETLTKLYKEDRIIINNS